MPILSEKTPRSRRRVRSSLSDNFAAVSKKPWRSIYSTTSLWTRNAELLSAIGCEDNLFDKCCMWDNLARDLLRQFFSSSLKALICNMSKEDATQQIYFTFLLRPFRRAIILVSCVCISSVPVCGNCLMALLSQATSFSNAFCCDLKFVRNCSWGNFNRALSRMRSFELMFSILRIKLRWTSSA